MTQPTEELYSEFQKLEEISKGVYNVVEKYKAFETESTKKVLEKMKLISDNIKDIMQENKDELEGDATVKKRHKQFIIAVAGALDALENCKKLGKKYQGSKKIKDLCRQITPAIQFNFVIGKTNMGTGTPPLSYSPSQSSRSSMVIPKRDSSLDKYEISFDSLQVLKEIGAGANGKVYEGKYNKVTRVALKYSSGAVANEFLKEVDLMVNLKPHPNIVQLLGYSRAPGTGELILVLELCTGGSLEQYRKKNKPTETILLSMLHSIAQGLCHLHVNSIVHRDLAARNILLHNKMCKISDFGMSRLRKTLEDQSQTCVKDVAIRWMPPEALQMKFNSGTFTVEYSTKVDVWGFGIVIYELVTGLEPHQKEDPMTIGGRIRDEGFHPPIPTDCPFVLQEIMKDCWSKDPSKRPDMSEICDRIEEAMEN